MNRGVIAAFVLACTIVSNRAGAQPTAQQSAQADALFNAARAEMSEGHALRAQGQRDAALRKYEGAIAKLRASDEIEPRRIGVYLNLGEVYAAAGKVASAWGAYTTAADLARSVDPKRFAFAQSQAAEIGPRVPRLTIRLAPQGSQDVSVTDNGSPVPSTGLGSALPVDPGPHTIIAVAKGRRAFSTSVDVGEGSSQEAMIPALEWLAGAPPEPAHDDSRRTVGTGLLVGGGVVTVAGLIVGAMALSKAGTVTDACPEYECRDVPTEQSVADQRDTAAAFATASTIVVGTGLVAMGVGLVLHLTAPKSASSTMGMRKLGFALALP